MVLDSLTDDLRPYKSRLYATLRDGLATFQERYGLYRGTMTTTGERMAVHDCLREAAKANFQDEYRECGQLFELVLGRYRVRLKKLDPYLRTSNYPTQAAFDFMSRNGEPSTGVLFEDLDPISLVLGYVPDGLDIRRSDLWLTQPKGLVVGPAWQHQLGVDAAASAEPLPATSPDVPGDGKSRVKPKSDAKPSKRVKIVDIDR